MAATGEVVRAREAQVEGAVADVEALKVAGTVAVGLARAVAVEMARGMVVGVATSWAWAEPGLSGAGPSEIPSIHHKTSTSTPHPNSPSSRRHAKTSQHTGSRMHRVEASCQPARPHYRCNQRSETSAAPGVVPVYRSWPCMDARVYGVKCRTWSMTTVGRSSAAANSSTATASARTLWI